VLKVKVKGHVIRALFWILGMSYSVIDGLVCFVTCFAAHRGGNRCLKIFLIVGFVGAGLIACIIVGVVVGVLMTTTTGVPRIPCDHIAERTIGALPYRFDNVSLNDCVYGYFSDGICMYDGRFDAQDNTDTGCYGKKFGADLIYPGCYYTDESCHCSMAYREDENLCYNFAVNITQIEKQGKKQPCPHGLYTGSFCLYDKRQKKSGGRCSKGWDKAVEHYCYMRKWKTCDEFMDDGIARKSCLKGASFVKDRSS